MIKVLHFIDSMNWGGAETLVLNTVELLNEDEEYQNFIMTLTVGRKSNRIGRVLFSGKQQEQPVF